MALMVNIDHRRQFFFAQIPNKHKVLSRDAEETKIKEQANDLLQIDEERRQYLTREHTLEKHFQNLTIIHAYPKRPPRHSKTLGLFCLDAVKN